MSIPCYTFKITCMKVIAISTENSLIRDELKETFEKAGVDYRILQPSNSAYREVVDFKPEVVILDITAGDWLVREMYDALKQVIDAKKYVLTTISKRNISRKFSDFDGEKIVPFRKSRLQAILKRSL